MAHCASKIEHMAGGGKFGDGPGPWRDGVFQADRARGARGLRFWVAYSVRPCGPGRSVAAVPR